MREALESFARTILPDSIAFFETEAGNRHIKNGLKRKNQKNRVKFDLFSYNMFDYENMFKCLIMKICLMYKILLKERFSIWK